MGGASTKRRDLAETLVVAMMLMTVVIVIDTTKTCGASSVTDTISWKSNDTNNIIAYEGLEMEFQTDSEISRRILQQKKYLTPGTANRSKPSNCGQARGQNYRCGGPGSGSNAPICTSAFQRSCKRG